LENATEALASILDKNHQNAVGVYSICSANRFVLEAGMLEAQRDRSLPLIESTSNQVNQFGGYTGQTPDQFVAFVKQIAGRMNFPAERIVIGGDHLGPHPWRDEFSASAMRKARDLVRACILAGYTKIHPSPDEVYTWAIGYDLPHSRAALKIRTFRKHRFLN
jgi:D-tagatose-1,6-bisphosphate aldolase subunit GatZ/KbaZ